MPYFGNKIRRKNKREQAWRLFWIIPLVIVGGIACLIVLIRLQPPSDSKRDETRNRVRVFLNNNLHDPNFEEMNWGKEVKWNKGVLISLKYRAKNQLGAWVLDTDVFYLKHNTVTLITDESIKKEYLRKSIKE